MSDLTGQAVGSAALPVFVRPVFRPRWPGLVSGLAWVVAGLAMGGHWRRDPAFIAPRRDILIALGHGEEFAR
ncbi:hypothetical protein [Gluconacetobacter asukensis]|uniref:hypothetical protein n=1 Tax=Gluconacetobacter asukensis TaxID=1017181 RepID=UPI001C7FF153|nr:hypothetical protein [Gluconacetobacter asukensis]